MFVEEVGIVHSPAVSGFGAAGFLNSTILNAIEGSDIPSGLPPLAEQGRVIGQANQFSLRGAGGGITMSAGLQYDEQTSKRIEAIYSTPDVVVQRKATLQVLELHPGEHVLDVGSGPGFLAADMAMEVGDSGRVRGIDISEAMVAIAQRRCANMAHLDFQVGTATRLPFQDGGFDAAVSTQVYEYLNDADVTTALSELYRTLRPGGRALILDTDGDSLVWHSTDPERMKRVLKVWSDHCVDFHLPKRLTSKLVQAGFQISRRDCIPLFNPDYDPNTYSYLLIGLIAAFVPGRRGVSQDEVEAWAEDLRRLGGEGLYFFSLNRYLFLATKPGSDSDG
jgi:ubiquinone/menaquinone biosynthesis C-methylase UbiE